MIRTLIYSRDSIVLLALPKLLEANAEGTELANLAAQIGLGSENKGNDAKR